MTASPTALMPILPTSSFNDPDEPQYGMATGWECSEHVALQQQQEPKPALSEFTVICMQRGANFPCEGKAWEGPKHFKRAHFIRPQGLILLKNSY